MDVQFIHPFTPRHAIRSHINEHSKCNVQHHFFSLSPCHTFAPVREGTTPIFKTNPRVHTLRWVAPDAQVSHTPQYTRMHTQTVQHYSVSPAPELKLTSVPTTSLSSFSSLSSNECPSASARHSTLPVADVVMS